MKGFRYGLMALVVMCVFSLVGCGFFDKETEVSLILDTNLASEEGMRETVVYYKDTKGMIVPVMKKILWEDGIAKAAVKLLVDEPVLREELGKIGLQPVLPEGTEVLEMSINEGLAKINFNDKFLAYETKEDEKAIVQSLVYTLTEFEAINEVKILVKGKEMNKLTFGTKINRALKRENINLSYEMNEVDIPVVVYYKGSTNGEDSYYVPVTKPVSALKADTKTVLSAMLEGAPEETGLYSELPEGVVLNDVYVKDGVAYVDFNEAIEYMPKNAELQQSIVYEIGFTLREAEPTISQVRILSNGKEIGLSAGVSINLPEYFNNY